LKQTEIKTPNHSKFRDKRKHSIITV
jgi:hypothetical protein